MRNRWVQGRMAAVLAGVVALVLLPVTALAAPGPDRVTGGADRLGAYVSREGRLDYQVHLPPTWRRDRPMPLIVAIHGCAMSGYGLNSMKETTRFDDLADREGFVVVYPTQSLLRNVKSCWNSLSPEHQSRGRGEPELIAGAVRQVIDGYGVDRTRVHVVGASSGAGTAVILGVTYPDVVATVTSVAGGEYGFQRVDLDRPDAVTPVDTARFAVAEMGPRARPVPLLVVQGDQDTTVPPIMAERLVRQWLVVADLAVDGRLDGDGTARPASTTRVTPAGGHAYTRSRYDGPDGGPEPLVEQYLIEGQGHAWSGPRGTGLFTDRLGPDLAELTWRFASTRSLPTAS